MEMSFGGMLAGGLRHLPMLARERLRLGLLAPVPCDAAALAPARALPLEAIMVSPRYAEEWAAVAGELEALQIAGGGVSLGGRRALFYLVRHLRPRGVLEVGTQLGAATAAICAALRRNVAEGGPAPRLVSVDSSDVNDAIAKPWIRAGSRYAPAQLVARMGCGGWVEFVGEGAASYLGRGGEGFELIVLAGERSAAASYREQSAALRRVAPGGLILLHGYFPGLRPLWPDGGLVAGPYLAARRLRDEGAPIEVLPLGGLPWPTRQGGSVTSLAVMGRA